MAFHSFVFLLFLLVVSVAYFIAPKRAKWAVLLTASYLFYFFWSTKLILFLWATTLSVYVAGRLLGAANDRFKEKKGVLSKEEKKAFKARINRQKKGIVTAAVLFNFGILAFLKYFNFLGGTINGISHGLGGTAFVPHLRLLLPLGISYYTLMAVSYVVDVYRGKCKADKNIGRLALFLSFFPQMVEGPIGRYGDMAHQLYEGHPFDYERLKSGGQLILWGLFKKMVIADRAGILVNEVFGNASAYQGAAVATAVVFYTVQIYAEFSGAMDIVTGAAQLFGVSMTQNFRRPFFSKSIQEFWRRWHITLGTWLKDYVFYPVSLSKGIVTLSKKMKKVSKGRWAKLVPAACSLFFVWFGNGIWHGASWKYVCYGLYYYAIMMLGMFFEPLTDRLLQTLRIKKEHPAYKAWQMARTTLLVFFGMLIFRADTLPMAGKMFRSIFIGGSGGASLLGLGLHIGDFVILGFSVALMFAVGVLQEKGYGIRAHLNRQHLALRWAVYLIAIFSIIIFGVYGDGYNVGSFIYGEF